MKYPVLLMPWPSGQPELRRIDWDEYLRDPTVGLLVDPATGEPYGNVITVRLQVSEVPPTADLQRLEVGLPATIPLAEFLDAEARRLDLGRRPWAEVVDFSIDHQPPPLDLEDGRKGLPDDFEAIKEFLYEVLSDGPHSELEVIGRAADQGIAPARLRAVKERLRIASVKDLESGYPRTLWRLRMSQAYKLKKKRSPNARR